MPDMTEIGVVVLLIVMVVFRLALNRPSTLLVSRSAVIAASPPVLFELLSDFRNWNKWLPAHQRLPPVAEGSSEEGFKSAGISPDGQTLKDWWGQMNMTVAIHPSRLVLLVQIVSRISSGIPKGDQFQLEFLFVPENSLTRVVCTITKSQGFRGRVEDLLIGSDRKLGRGIEDVFRQLETTALKMAESGASQ